MIISDSLKVLGKSDVKTYSDQAVVIQTYRVQDQKELYAKGALPVEYDKYLHLTCDVRLIKDGSMLYGVKLSPHILNENDKIIDGSGDVVGNGNNNVNVHVPMIGSYVFISWLDSENSYISFSSESESIVIGSPNGSYIDFYTKEETRIISLENTDKFQVQFPNEKLFKIETKDDVTEWIVLMNTILLSNGKNKIDIKNDAMDFIVDSNSKIEISNGTINLKDILNNIITELITYFNSIESVLVSAGLTSSVTVQKLQKVNEDVNALFK